MFNGNNKRTRRKILLQILAAVIVIGLALWFAQFARDSDFVKAMVLQYGYAAIFFISLISGFNILFPIPSPSFVPLFLESGLNLWITILVMTVGLTIADLLGFIIGKIGRNIAEGWKNQKIIKRLERLREKNFWAPIIFLFFFATSAPLPNEVVVIPLAFIGYQARHLFIPLFLGHIIFNTWTSFAIIGLFNAL